MVAHVQTEPRNRPCASNATLAPTALRQLHPLVGRLVAYAIPFAAATPHSLHLANRAGAEATARNSRVVPLRATAGRGHQSSQSLPRILSVRRPTGRAAWRALQHQLAPQMACEGHAVRRARHHPRPTPRLLSGPPGRILQQSSVVLVIAAGVRPTPEISCEAVAPVPRRRGHAAAPCRIRPGAAASLVSFIALFGGRSSVVESQDPALREREEARLLGHLHARSQIR